MGRRRRVLTLGLAQRAGTRAKTPRCRAGPKRGQEQRGRSARGNGGGVGSAAVGVRRCGRADPLRRLLRRRSGVLRAPAPAPGRPALPRHPRPPARRAPSAASGVASAPIVGGRWLRLVHLCHRRSGSWLLSRHALEDCGFELLICRRHALTRIPRHCRVRLLSLGGLTPPSHRRRELSLSLLGQLAKRVTCIRAAEPNGAPGEAPQARGAGRSPSGGCRAPSPSDSGSRSSSGGFAGPARCSRRC